MYCELYNRDIMNKINCDSTNGYFITKRSIINTVALHKICDGYGDLNSNYYTD